MIVSCPSCDSKYQVADEKVAGNVLRTRCKACGSQILVDGTIPPGPKSDEDEDDVTRIMRPEDRPDLGKSQPPASTSRWTVHLGDSDTRPMTVDEIVQAFVNGALGDDVSVWKSGMSNWASIADVPELMAAIEKTGHHTKKGAAGMARNSKPPPPTRTSKPPPPSRAAAADNATKSSAVKASPVVAISKKVEKTQDALDPAASTTDFYSKLLSKVGASKSKSTPPAASAEPMQPNRPRATLPPPRNTTSVAASRNSPARISNIKKEPAVQDVPSNLDPEAAPGDFYAKILAKVRPQKPETVPPAKAELKSSSTGRNTLPPPNWGAVSNQSENYAQAHPPSRVPASTQSVTASPIRVLGSSPAQSFGSAASSTSAAGEVDIPVNVEADFADNSIEQPGGPGASQAAAPAAFRRASPAPPKRPDPVIPVDIQLPPMDGNAETRLPSGLSVVISPSTPPPASESKAETKSETKPEATSKPSTEIVTDITSPGLRAYRKGRTTAICRSGYCDYHGRLAWSGWRSRSHRVCTQIFNQKYKSNRPVCIGCRNSTQQLTAAVFRNTTTVSSTHAKRGVYRCR